MLFRIVFAVVKFFFPKLKITTKQEIKGPAVFVCNHLGAFGPIAMVLYFPAGIRPWVNYRMFKRGLAAQEISENLFNSKAKVPVWIKKVIGRILEIPALWVMRLLGAIPVYFDPINVRLTLNKSVQALKAGVNIAVFADKDGEHLDESVKEGIYNGCVYIAPIYGRKAEEPLLFYPVHISRKRQEILVGEPVTFDKSRITKNEIQRVSSYLSKAIQDLSYDDNKKV
jgi:hypothetical protein